MAKTIKMIAVVNGKETLVGRCHPGQARILRRAGLAEWGKDKLVLLGTAPEPPPLAPIRIQGEGGELGPQSGKLKWEKLPPHPSNRETPGWTHYPIFQQVLELCPDLVLEEINEIDPEGLIYLGDARPRPGGMNPEEHQCENVTMWLKELRSRQEAGHPTLSCDNPRTLSVGFVDDTDNVVFSIPVRKFKEATDEELEALGVSREDICTREGRLNLVQKNSSVYFEGYPILNLLDKDENLLEDLWVEEAREANRELSKNEKRPLEEYFGVSNPRGDLPQIPWTLDEIRKACNLKPREDFLADYAKLKEEAHNRLDPWEPDRRSGRTTEIILDAVKAALDGNQVSFKSHCRDMTHDMISQARKMAAQCGYVTLVFHPYKKGQPPEWMVFEDHFLPPPVS